MKKFLIKIGVVLALVVLVHGITVLIFANGKIDGFYLRFTTPQQHSLVIGNSRAAQGIVPHVIDEHLRGQNFEGPLFTYSFTLSTSAYGPYYLASIKKKLDHSTRRGLFILSVDPWSISRDAELKTDDTTKYADRWTLPYNMNFVNTNPNIEFLLKNYHKGWGDMILANTVRTVQSELHSNGWLEITIPMIKGKHEQRMRDKINLYRKQNFHTKTLSAIRLEYLKKTIRYLKQYGEVYLVRIPLDERLAELEREYLPEFDELMKDCASELNVPYFNYLGDNALYQTTDGNHLYKESAKVFTEKLAQDIRKHAALQASK